MKNELKIALIQANLAWENPIQNRINFLEKINTVSEAVDLIILPEMFTSGFTMNAEKIAETMDGKTVTWLKKIAQEKDAAITGSIVIKAHGDYFNRCFFVEPDGTISTYDKRHTFTLAGEDKVYRAGKTKTIINYKGWKICPLICYDLRFPVWARNIENYDLLIFMANWPVKRIKAWETLLKARSIENMCYTIGVNRTGIDANNYNYSGNSLVVDYLGEEISNLPKNEIGIISATIDRKNQDKIRKKLGFLNDMDSFIVTNSK